MNLEKIILFFAMLIAGGVGYIGYQQQLHYDQFQELISILESIDEMKPSQPNQPIMQQPQQQSSCHQQPVQQAINLPASIIQISQENDLRRLLQENKKPSVVFFYMNGCGWCKKMEPVFAQVSQNPKFKNLEFIMVNGRDAQAPMVVKQMLEQQIQGYPFIIFMNEGKFIDKQVGFAQQEQFEQKLSQIFQS